VRLQLRPRRHAFAPLVLAAVGLAPAGARAANADASSRVTLFEEPAGNHKGVRVLHPQVDATATVANSVSFALGYNVDIVTGATPKTFAPKTSVDAVTKATNFSDTRHQFNGGMGLERPDGGISASYSYGFESDYRSHALSATTRNDLYEHNFTLALAYTHNWDRVCDNNNAPAGGNLLALIPLSESTNCFTSSPTVVTRHLSIDSFEPSLSWTMTPRLVVQGGTTIQILDGFQSNPYRAVQFGSQNHAPQERHPEFRQRYAAFFRLAYAFPEQRASTLGMLRLYEDSWAVRAVTGDVVVNKYVGESILVSVRGHYHLQSGASFYRGANDLRILGPTGTYWTGDRELSPMSNYLVGGKFAYLRRPGRDKASWFVEMELDAKYELLLYQLEKDAPNADRPYAHIVQGAFTLRW
jgi:hypothetical protein